MDYDHHVKLFWSIKTIERYHSMNKPITGLVTMFANELEIPKCHLVGTVLAYI